MIEDIDWHYFTRSKIIVTTARNMIQCIVFQLDTFRIEEVLFSPSVSAGLTISFVLAMDSTLSTHLTIPTG